MDGLRQWALCLIISAAAVAFVTIITPRGSTDKTVRSVAGIFVVSAIFTPLADISFDFTAVNAAEYADVQSNDLSDSVLDACRNAAEDAILSVADERGVTVEKIFMDAYIDADNCIIIQSVTVAVSTDNTKKTDELEAVFSNLLGVPVKVNAE